MSGTESVDGRRRQLIQAGGGLALGAALGGWSGVAGAASLPLSEYEQLDAIGLADLIRRRKLSAPEALEAAIARVDAVNARLNCVNIPFYDMARAVARGPLGEGPLAGVPFLLKDLGLQVKGTVTSNGSVFFRDAVADQDSTLTGRYRKAGLVMFGKTASPEFGATATTESRAWGKTHNPWNLDYSTGGSSGGSAAAVAAGIVPAAHASDGGGSIRIPASHCGLFGLKTSRGRNPVGPVALESWMGLSVQHVISRSVRDSALFLQVSQGPEPGSRIYPPALSGDLVKALRNPPKGLRIALMDGNPFGAPVHPECLLGVHNAARLCEQLGHHVESVAPKLPIAEMFGGMGVMTGTGTLVLIRAREKALGRAVREDELEPLNWLAFQQAQHYTAAQLYQARAIFDQAGRILDQFMADYDIILSPTTAGLPPKLGVLALDQPYDDFAREAMKASPFTAIFNMSGQPAMSVPLHWSAEGLPIGVQFAGRYGEELTLLRLAAQLEQARPWAQKRPHI